MFETLIWDNDGVLVDTERLYFQATREVLAEAGFELSRSEYIRISLELGSSCFDIAPQLSAEEVERLRGVRNRRYTEMLTHSVTIMPGVRECLDALSGKLRMGVVTGSRRDHYETMHERTGLRRYFDFELTHDEYERSKPDPQPFLRAFERFGIDPTRALAVDDAPRGIQGAYAAGLICVAIPNELTKGSDFPGATRVIDGVAQLPSVIAELSAR